MFVQLQGIALRTDTPTQARFTSELLVTAAEAAMAVEELEERIVLVQAFT